MKTIKLNKNKNGRSIWTEWYLPSENSGWIKLYRKEQRIIKLIKLFGFTTNNEKVRT